MQISAAALHSDQQEVSSACPAVHSGDDVRQVVMQYSEEAGAHAAAAGSAGSGSSLQTVVYELGMMSAGRWPLCIACMLRPPAPELRGSKFVRAPVCVCRIRAAVPLCTAASNVRCCSASPCARDGVASGDAQLSYSERPLRELRCAHSSQPCAGGSGPARSLQQQNQRHSGLGCRRRLPVRVSAWAACQAGTCTSGWKGHLVVTGQGAATCTRAPMTLLLKRAVTGMAFVPTPPACIGTTRVSARGCSPCGRRLAGWGPRCRAHEDLVSGCAGAAPPAPAGSGFTWTVEADERRWTAGCCLARPLRLHHERRVPAVQLHLDRRGRCRRRQREWLPEHSAAQGAAAAHCRILQA